MRFDPPCRGPHDDEIVGRHNAPWDLFWAEQAEIRVFCKPTMRMYPLEKVVNSQNCEGIFSLETSKYFSYFNER